MGKFRDLSGQRFGDLTVLKCVGRTTSGNALWLCRCDCGRQKEVRGHSLVVNKTRSCGCKQMVAAQAARRLHIKCTLPGCDRPHLALGYCRSHYERLKKVGTPEKSERRVLAEMSLGDAFTLLFEASEPTVDGCLLWAGSKMAMGYGRIHRENIHYKAHRLAYERFKGPIPYGMEVCHTCDNPSCVNPDHLFVGTAKDNALDREAKGRGHHETKLISFAFVSPTGEIVSDIGLSRFCTKHGLLQPKMTEVLRGSRRHHKGWTKHG